MDKYRPTIILTVYSSVYRMKQKNAFNSRKNLLKISL